jgi:hypothetical protein
VQKEYMRTYRASPRVRERILEKRVQKCEKRLEDAKTLLRDHRDKLPWTPRPPGKTVLALARAGAYELFRGRILCAHWFGEKHATALRNWLKHNPSAEKEFSLKYLEDELKEKGVI